MLLRLKYHTNNKRMKDQMLDNHVNEVKHLFHNAEHDKDDCLIA